MSQAQSRKIKNRKFTNFFGLVRLSASGILLDIEISDENGSAKPAICCVQSKCDSVI